jgi:hypothetical protein
LHRDTLRRYLLPLPLIKSQIFSLGKKTKKIFAAKVEKINPFPFAFEGDQSDQMILRKCSPKCSPVRILAKL